jgi:hypothetical protein
MKLKVAVLAASLVAILDLPQVPVNAQNTSSSSANAPSGEANSLRISPVRTDIALDPGSSKSIDVLAQNLSPTTVRLQATLSDFEPSKDESGDPLVILNDEYAKSHSLKRLAIITPQIITLAPNETGTVKVVITAPKSALAGGYYGAVRFFPANDDSPDGNGVGVSTNVGSLVLLKVNGDIKQKMTLASMDVRQKDKAGSFFKTPDGIKAVIRFKNEGNVQEQPFGKVQLTKSGKVIQEIEVNNTEPRGNVLPDSIRKFEVDLNKVGKFGKYTVKGNFGYGNGELISSTTSFWVVPTTYMIGAAVALLIIGLIIFLSIKVARLSRRGGGGHSRRY